ISASSRYDGRATAWSTATAARRLPAADLLRDADEVDVLPDARAERSRRVVARIQPGHDLSLTHQRARHVGRRHVRAAELRPCEILELHDEPAGVERLLLGRKQLLTKALAVGSEPEQAARLPP